MGNNGNGAGPKAVNGHAARVQMTPAQAKRAEPAAKVNGAPKKASDALFHNRLAGVVSPEIPEILARRGVAVPVGIG